jgi:hypothetical protein
MGGKLTIKNNDSTEFTIEHIDGSSAKSLNSKDFKYIRDTIKDLATINNPSDGDVVLVKGYHSVNDGGGGLFIYHSGEPKTNHNGGTIVDATKTFPTNWSNQTELESWFSGDNTGNGCWKRVYDGYVNVKWFGAYDDGTHPDETTAAFKAFISAGYRTMILPEGIFRLNDQILIDYKILIRGSGDEGKTVIQSEGYSESVFKFTSTFRIENLYMIPLGDTDIQIYGTHGGHIKDVYFNMGESTAPAEHSASPVYFYCCDNILIEGCTFINGWRDHNYNASNYGGSNSSGICIVNDNNSNVKIINNYFKNVWSAIKVSNTNNLEICHNYIEETADTAIFDRCTLGVTKNKNISYNILKNIGKAGIKTLDSNNLTAKGHNSTVIGNQIEGWGLYLSTAAIFSKNYYDYNGELGDPAYHKADDDFKATGLVIADNILIQSPDGSNVPIQVANVTDCVIKGNVLNNEAITGDFNVATWSNVVFSENTVKINGGRLSFYECEVLHVLNNSIKSFGGLYLIQGNSKSIISNNILTNTNTEAHYGFFLSCSNAKNGLDSLVITNNIVEIGFAKVDTNDTSGKNPLAIGTSDVATLEKVILDNLSIIDTDGIHTVKTSFGTIENPNYYGGIKGTTTYDKVNLTLRIKPSGDRTDIDTVTFTD